MAAFPTQDPARAARVLERKRWPPRLVRLRRAAAAAAAAAREPHHLCCTISHLPSSSTSRPQHQPLLVLVLLSSRPRPLLLSLRFTTALPLPPPPLQPSSLRSSRHRSTTTTRSPRHLRRLRPLVRVLPPARPLCSPRPTTPWKTPISTTTTNRRRRNTSPAPITASEVTADMTAITSRPRWTATTVAASTRISSATMP